jgi:hypothetical protein
MKLVFHKITENEAGDKASPERRDEAVEPLEEDGLGCGWSEDVLSSRPPPTKFRR